MKCTSIWFMIFPDLCVHRWQQKAPAPGWRAALWSLEEPGLKRPQNVCLAKKRIKVLLPLLTCNVILAIFPWVCIAEKECFCLVGSVKNKLPLNCVIGIKNTKKLIIFECMFKEFNTSPLHCTPPAADSFCQNGRKVHSFKTLNLGTTPYYLAGNSASSSMTGHGSWGKVIELLK